ncbi:hypothetical protein BCR34DRAFT_179234 [Clohesyomyces aquaticus]|uniref:Uncharacterized protein n=1 Tax=Clohesyomyces aquaticus TaxID=1231657 RepID=A0A1Y1YG33_9PLEO|nr:hypothetical protein BCR34DRAFT_179234 [Clohesyomyces aquaticus]
MVMKTTRGKGLHSSGGDGRPAPALTLRRRRWFVDIAEEKSAVCSCRWCRVLLSMATMNNPKLLTTLPGRTEAHLYGPRDCSVHVCSGWSFDRTTAVSPEHAGPSHLRMCLQRWRAACGTKPTRRGAGFDFQCLPHSIRPYNRIPLQRAETTSWLVPLGLGIGAGRLEKHDDVVA